MPLLYNSSCLCSPFNSLKGALRGRKSPLGDLGVTKILNTLLNKRLQIIKFFVSASVAEQRTMCAALNNFSFMKNNNFVRVHNGRQAMGDNNGGSVFNEPQKRFLHQPLAFRVKRRGGFVKNKYGRIF